MECPTEDDIEYCKSITFKDTMVDGSNDDIGASITGVDYYRGSLVICKGVLYINYNNIWIKKKTIR